MSTETYTPVSFHESDGVDFLTGTKHGENSPGDELVRANISPLRSYTAALFVQHQVRGLSLGVERTSLNEEVKSKML